MSEGAGQIVTEGYLKYGERGGEEDDIDLNSLLLDLGVDAILAQDGSSGCAHASFVRHNRETKLNSPIETYFDGP